MPTLISWKTLAPRATVLAGVLALLLAAPLPGAMVAAGQGTPAALLVAAAAASVEIGGLVERTGPITVEELRGLPAETVDVTDETRDGAEQQTLTGTRLYPVLEGAGPIVGPEERNPWLTR